MDPILNAVERAKASAPQTNNRPQPTVQPIGSHSPSPRTPIIQLDRALLEQNRIVAHDAGDPRTRPFDILRTQTLAEIDKNHWQFLAVTSPRPGCGKTLTAINLALSISRLPEKSVLLVDLDLHKPEVTKSIGLSAKEGVVGILGGSGTLSGSIIEACAGSAAVKILPAESRVTDTSELIAARTMRTLLHDIKTTYPGHIVIIDMPPMLGTDDVLTLLPQIDCVLLIAAVGNSSVSDIKACAQHLHSTPLVKLVLNKSIEPMDQYDYY